MTRNLATSTNHLVTDLRATASAEQISQFATSLPILSASESERLSVTALLTSRELELLRASLERKAIQEERAKLASLVTHGIAHLTRLMAGKHILDEPVRRWLSAYLMRRVNVVADLFSGWSAPLGEIQHEELAIARRSVRNTLESLQRLAAIVATDRELRRNLQWGNGVLSRLARGCLPFRFDLQDWSEDVHLTTRIDGAETFIFDELLINAFKHGKPGSPPQLTARIIRGTQRRWVEFELRNQVRSTREASIAGAEHRYGGQTLVKEACRRLRWELLPPQLQGETYIIRWHARSLEAPEDHGDAGLDPQ